MYLAECCVVLRVSDQDLADPGWNSFCAMEAHWMNLTIQSCYGCNAERRNMFCSELFGEKVGSKCTRFERDKNGV